MLILLVVTFAAFMVIAVPISWSILGSTMLLTIFLPQIDMITVTHKMLYGVDSFVLLALPFFFLVGQLMSRGDTLQRLIELNRLLFGRLTGGLAHVNVATNMVVSGITGSAGADIAAIGTLMIPTLVKDKYDPPFAAALNASAAVLGPIIPPSIPMVVLGAMFGISIGRLFLAGFMPGFLMGGSMMIVSYVLAKRRGYGQIKMKWSLKEFIRVAVRAIGPLMLPVIIVGGIVGGFFTATEASDIAVLLVVVLGIAYRTFTLRETWQAIQETLQLLGPVMLIISAASAFSNLLILQKAGEIVATTMLSISKDPTVTLIMISLVVLILGCFMESLAIMMVIVPIVVPIVQILGIDLIHFGLVFCLALAIGLVTPPVGITMYISCAIAKISIPAFARANMYFLIVLVLDLIICIYWPEFVTFIPYLLMPGN